MSNLDLNDEEIIEELQKHRIPYHVDSEGVDTWFIDVQTEDFVIYINPVGSDLAIDHIKNCNKVMIEIYDRGEMPDPETLKIPDLEVPGFEKITFNVRCFPHKGIRPFSDIRFSGQSWSKHFTLTALYPTATTGCCSLQETCDIIRYCLKIQNLKAFL